MDAKRLEKLRVKKGLSQVEFAERIGVSRQAVWKMESGFMNPSVETLKLIAKLFNVTTDYLLGM
jgi:transcriptional regulator with XRE-family HTH domain